ncbi:MAG: cytochrome c biogenesis protein CcsA [Gammaproteobacteria bacterium]
MNIDYIAILAIVLYLSAGIKLGLRLAKGALAVRYKGVFLTLGFGAIVLHAWVLYQNLFVVNGLNMGIFNAMSLLSWIIVSVILVTSFTQPVENLGIAAFPLAAMALTLELVFPSSPEAHLVSKDVPAGLKIHILVSILSYSLFTIAACQAFLLSLQNKHLHSKRPGGFIRALPPLETMEALLFSLLWTGIITLTVSIITGFIFLDNMFAQHVVHHTVLAMASWVVYAVLLAGRRFFGWRSTTALGSKWVLEVLLGR